MPENTNTRTTALAIIGSAGVPQRYGGFEAFVEHCGPKLLSHFSRVYVSCDRQLYPDRTPEYRGMLRGFPPFRANGAQSILHDLAAFLWALPKARHILILGVSGGPWFPLMRLLAALTGARIAVNIDGVEWQRGKHGRLRRIALRAFDWMAQRCSHVVVYDNAALSDYVVPAARQRSVMIPYSGEHAAPQRARTLRDGIHALTICRIEPENNIDTLITGFLKSHGDSYTIVGNWNASEYGRHLRARYGAEHRLTLADPTYDAERIQEYRSAATVYLHGHSVGGTNPSLVEMVFFPVRLLCLDVAFHRATVGHCAEYFSNADELCLLLNARSSAQPDRTELLSQYASTVISAKYAKALLEIP